MLTGLLSSGRIYVPFPRWDFLIPTLVELFNASITTNYGISIYFALLRYSLLVAAAMLRGSPGRHRVHVQAQSSINHQTHSGANYE